MNTPSHEPPLDIIRPYYPVLAQIFPLALRRVQLTRLLLGDAKRVERAGHMKQAVRNLLRPLCDEMDPFLKLVEMPECSGFDHVIAAIDDKAVAIRWGHLPRTGVVQRNPSRNTAMTRGQQALFEGMDQEMAGIPLVSMVYVLADTFTLASVDQTYVARVHIGREWSGWQTDIVETLAEFTEPGPMVSTDVKILEREVRLTEEKAAELRRQARDILRFG